MEATATRGVVDAAPYDVPRLSLLPGVCCLEDQFFFIWCRKAQTARAVRATA